jgi:hypothetical protein
MQLLVMTSVRGIPTFANLIVNYIHMYSVLILIRHNWRSSGNPSVDC